MAGWVLAIDFGTSYTMVAIAEGGRVELVDVDGVRAMPSGVWLDTAGGLVVGTAGERQARLAPERWERAPKKLLGEVAPLLLGGRRVAVVDAVAAVLRHAAGEAVRRQGGLPEEVRLTYPARWGERRRGALEAAAGLAGLGVPLVAVPPRLLPEPVAAALYFADRGQLPAGAQAAVYDLGGGTFDTAVLSADEAGYTVRALGGIDGVGGETFDALLYAHVGEQVAAHDASVWRSLSDPPDARWRRYGEDLYREVRRAKEDLSRYPSVTLDTESLVGVPLQLTRGELESVLRPRIEATARELADTIGRAGRRPADLAAVYLAGGSSRIPLVERVVSDMLGVTARVLGEPKSVVAAGAARFNVGAPVRVAVPGPVEPIPQRTPTPVPGPVDELPTRIIDTASLSRTTTPAQQRGQVDQQHIANYRPDPRPEPRPRSLWRHPATIAAAVLILLGGLGAIYLITRDPPPSSRLAAPTGLTTSVSGDKVELSWTAVPGAARYVVRRDFRVTVSDSLTTGTSLTDQPGDQGSHSYYVYAIDAKGKSGVSSRTVTAQVKAGLSPEEQKLVDRLPASLVDATSCTSAKGGTAAVTCQPATASTPSPPAVAPVKIYATQFADSSSLETSRDAALSDAGQQPSGSDCQPPAAPPSKTTWHFNSAPDTKVGVIYCYDYEGTATVEWGYYSSAILIGADGPDTDIDGLMAWWAKTPKVLKPAGG